MEPRTDHASTLAASEPKMLDDVLATFRKAALPVELNDKIKVADLINSMVVAGLPGAGQAGGPDPLKRAERQVLSAQLEGLIDGYIHTKSHEGNPRFNQVSVAAALHGLQQKTSFKIGEWIATCEQSSEHTRGLTVSDTPEKVAEAIRVAVEQASTKMRPVSPNVQYR